MVDNNIIIIVGLFKQWSTRQYVPCYAQPGSQLLFLRGNIISKPIIIKFIIIQLGYRNISISYTNDNILLQNEQQASPFQSGEEVKVEDKMKV
jgi:hypothetical protein